ncbi:hypothetical protein [Absidia glauca]|uniref:Uncharacterized protein n=1 Tax=Absidia glauca TaxID=4829 RepID=A0A163JTQ9_ABSGL|nr:hypothetical protein [Absidia glauca]
MLLSLPTSNLVDDSTLTYTLPCQGTKHMKRRSFWRSGHAALLSSLSRKRSNTHSSDTLTSSDSDSSTSSLPQLSDLSPTNHPPPHVFGKADQGYSMFYLKLPNGNWMVRCRTADRRIIATYEVDGSMI